MASDRRLLLPPGREEVATFHTMRDVLGLRGRHTELEKLAKAVIEPHPSLSSVAVLRLAASLTAAILHLVELAGSASESPDLSGEQMTPAPCTRPARRVPPRLRLTWLHTLLLQS